MITLSPGQVFEDAALRQRLEIEAVFWSDRGPVCQYRWHNGNLPAGRGVTVGVMPVEVMVNGLRGYREVVAS